LSALSPFFSSFLPLPSCTHSRPAQPLSAAGQAFHCACSTERSVVLFCLPLVLGQHDVVVGGLVAMRHAYVTGLPRLAAGSAMDSAGRWSAHNAPWRRR
jgi:hypothetical protein